MGPRNVTTTVHHSSPDFTRYCITCNKELEISDRAALLASGIHAQEMYGQEAPVAKQEQLKINTNTEPLPTPSVSMTWVCTVCDKEVNIFTRTDHLGSKPHVSLVRKQQKQKITEQTIPESWMWKCIVCKQTMSIFYQGEHLAGKAHAWVLRKKGLPWIIQLVEPRIGA